MAATACQASAARLCLPSRRHRTASARNASAPPPPASTPRRDRAPTGPVLPHRDSSAPRPRVDWRVRAGAPRPGFRARSRNTSMAQRPAGPNGASRHPPPARSDFSRLCSRTGSERRGVARPHEVEVASRNLGARARRRFAAHRTTCARARSRRQLSVSGQPPGEAAASLQNRRAGWSMSTCGISPTSTPTDGTDGASRAPARRTTCR